MNDIETGGDYGCIAWQPKDNTQLDWAAYVEIWQAKVDGCPLAVIEKRPQAFIPVIQ